MTIKRTVSLGVLALVVLTGCATTKPYAGIDTRTDAAVQVSPATDSFEAGGCLDENGGFAHASSACEIETP